MVLAALVTAWSHVMQPTVHPAETAETIAWIADRVLTD